MILDMYTEKFMHSEQNKKMYLKRKPHSNTAAFVKYNTYNSSRNGGKWKAKFMVELFKNGPKSDINLKLLMHLLFFKWQKLQFQIFSHRKLMVRIGNGKYRK